MQPASDAAASLRTGIPLRNEPNAVCRGRLDEAAAVPVTDTRAVEGQERLMRWRYGAADESAREDEFASLTALAAQCLTPEMLRRAQPELRPVLPLDGDPWPRTQPELSPLWTDPLWMAAAAHVAQRLSATRYRPERSVLWLNLHQPGPEHPWKRLYWRNPALHGTALVFGPFHHDTEHIRMHTTEVVQLQVDVHLRGVSIQAVPDQFLHGAPSGSVRRATFSMKSGRTSTGIRICEVCTGPGRPSTVRTRHMPPDSETWRSIAG
ncbi:hypothetical protein [Streptomyces sp. NPDC056669]|uniref:hypothetical protein n=1 Tax=Streptomyces sp. NPDC056669 TaxID=3345903 RepID=UPI0036CAD2D9